MYDELTGRFTFSCPARESVVRVQLSAFRLLERLPGAAHPALFRVTFACPCGEEHESLVSHDELDWAPLGASSTSFFNVMTARFEPIASEFLDRAIRRIHAGSWPWSFFCYPEERPRPTFPSAFRLLAPSRERVGVAVRCPGCGRTSFNLVSCDHIDLPFYSDPCVDVAEHVFASDADETLEAFREELGSRSFELRHRDLGD